MHLHYSPLGLFLVVLYSLFAIVILATSVSSNSFDGPAIILVILPFGLPLVYLARSVHDFTVLAYTFSVIHTVCIYFLGSGVANLRRRYFK